MVVSLSVGTICTHKTVSCSNHKSVAKSATVACSLTSLKCVCVCVCVSVSHLRTNLLCLTPLSLTQPMTVTLKRACWHPEQQGQDTSALSQAHTLDPSTPGPSWAPGVSRVLCSFLVAQSCPTLCDPMDCSPPSSSVHGISQTRTLEGAAVSSSRGSSWPGIESMSPVSPALAGGFFTTAPPGNPFQGLLHE